MPHRAAQAISPVDAAWLRMDSPTNPMVVTALVTYDEVLDRAAVDAALNRLKEHPRFTMRVVEGNRWEPDRSFDLRAHLHRVAVPSPCDELAMAELVGDLMSQPLDRDRPLWSIHLVEGCPKGSALIVRLHHALGDPVALVGVLLHLIDGGSVSFPAPSPVPPFGTARLAKRAAEQALALGRLVLMPSDPLSPLKGPLGRVKRASFSPPISLETVKALARRSSVKVSDILMELTTGALRMYLEEEVGRSELPELRALVPVLLPSQTETGDRSNHFGLVFLPLPLAEGTAYGRLRAVKDRMDALKATPEALVTFEILAAMGVAAPELERIGVEIFARKASLLVSSIAGPTAPVSLAGRRVTGVTVWGPAAAEIGLSITLMSYAGEVRVGVAVDALRVPDPSRIARGFERELERLSRGP